MNTISINQFRDKLEAVVEQVADQYEPMKVTDSTGQDFVVISAEDWEREQETLHALQSQDLMQQIADSMQTHSQGKD
ncbi:type II toxin-antitoxin system Phd/YefM family antitoxin [Oceanospirillum sp.]|uniref:type II toxin-antitoxin system Phd/YefM family antitoxin n=1 Tax=Oceanospirillum sp. TaxID=2021254 RepID=UPI003A8E238E